MLSHHKEATTHTLAVLLSIWSEANQQENSWHHSLLPYLDRFMCYSCIGIDILVAQCNDMSTLNDCGSFIRCYIPSKAGIIALAASGMFAVSILLAATECLQEIQRSGAYLPAGTYSNII
jgi:hypothetical protein